MPPGDRRSSRRAASRRRGNPVWVPVTAAAGAIMIIIGLIMYLGGGDGTSATSAAAGATASAAASHGDSGGSRAPSPSPVLVSGCMTGKSIAAGSSQQSLTVAGVARTYQLAVPAPDTRAKALPLVVGFHAFGENASALERYAHLAEIGTKSGFVIVVPDGANGRWNFMRRVAIGPDDVAFVSAIVNDLTARMCLDPRRMFATGLGDGADMAVTAACALTGTFTAVVPVASAVMPASCPAPTPSLFAISGTSDPVTPLEGGGTDRPAPFDGTQAQPMRVRLDRYAGFVGCSPANSWVRDTSSIQRLVYTACPNGRDVGLLAVQGGGHSWPDPDADPPKGVQRAQFSATRVALAYFQGHAAPAPATQPPGATG